MINEITQTTDTHKLLSEMNQTKTKNQNDSMTGTFEQLLEETDRNLRSADQAVMKANTGGKVDLHEMMISMEKADISLRLLVQVRNKAIDAYQEIMRMQV